MRLKTHQRDWNDLGAMDPYWAILSAERTQFGQWDVDEFFRTGERQVAEVMASAEALGYPAARETVLDFGCGVGRLTRAFASRFEECYGVDISERMIERAQELQQDYPTCHFAVNASDDLQRFPDRTFDMIYSVLVLQHVPSQAIIRSYLAEFTRVLKPEGLLVFQLPSFIEPRYRRQARMRLYSMLRSAGVSQRILYERLGLHPIRMRYLPEAEVRALLEAHGATVLDMRPDSLALPHESRTYFVTKDGT